MRITFKGLGRAAKKVGADLKDVAEKTGKNTAKKAGEWVPDPVKKGAKKVKDAVDEKTKGVREYGKKLMEEASDEDRIDSLAREARKKGKNVTVSERKDGRYHKIKDITYDDVKSKPKIGERSLDKTQIAKDVGAGAAAAGAVGGAAALLDNDEQEDLVSQIKRKMENGEELTASEKRLLRLMEA